MSGFICPICGLPLISDTRSFRCQSNHCYDVAKQGYVNLLCSQSPSGSRHGDDKLMVMARRDFLELGYYDNLRSKLTEEVVRASKKDCSILDAGCGEGWYTQKIAESVQSKCENTHILGIDISKDAVSYAARKCNDVEFAVASAFSLPVSDESTDVIISVFAPLAATEFLRVLRPSGTLFIVVPREKHLIELKEAIYDQAYENPPESETLEGFTLIDNIHLDNTITLKSNEEIENLFKMTPYYYKTGKKDQEKLESLDKLTVTTEFAILKYRKS